MNIINIIRDKIEYARLESEKTKKDTQDYYIKVIEDLKKNQEKEIEKIKDQNNMRVKEIHLNNKKKFNKRVEEIQKKFIERLNEKDIEIKIAKSFVKDAQDFYDDVRFKMVQFETASKKFSDYRQYETMLAAEREQRTAIFESEVTRMVNFMHQNEKHFKKLLNLNNNELN